MLGVLFCSYVITNTSSQHHGCRWNLKSVGLFSFCHKHLTRCKPPPQGLWSFQYKMITWGEMSDYFLRQTGGDGGKTRERLGERRARRESVWSEPRTEDFESQPNSQGRSPGLRKREGGGVKSFSDAVSLNWCVIYCLPLYSAGILGCCQAPTWKV